MKKETNDRNKLRESLEHIVEEFISEDDYSRAAEAQRMVIEETSYNMEEAYIRQFHILIKLERIHEAVEEGLRGAHYCIEQTTYEKALSTYRLIMTTMSKYHRQQVDERQIITMCYEICLCEMGDSAGALSVLDTTLTGLVLQFPYFSESTEYKALKNKDYNLWSIKELSFWQRCLLTRIRQAHEMRRTRRDSQLMKSATIKRCSSGLSIRYTSK